jgi:hypothetical protein
MGFYISNSYIIEIIFIVHSFARQTFELCAAHYSVMMCCVVIYQCVEVFPILQPMFCCSAIQ